MACKLGIQRQRCESIPTHHAYPLNSFAIHTLFPSLMKVVQFDCAAHVIDTWVNMTSHDRSNVAPASLPWDMIRSLVLSAYGGKVDHDGDYDNLATVINRVLVPGTFEDDFDVVKAVAMDTLDDSSVHHQLILPSATNWSAFESWVADLPEREPPSYLGLPGNAEKLLLVEQGKDMVRNVRNVMKILDESEQILAEANAEASESHASTIV